MLIAGKQDGTGNFLQRISVKVILLQRLQKEMEVVNLLHKHESFYLTACLEYKTNASGSNDSTPDVGIKYLLWNIPGTSS